MLDVVGAAWRRIVQTMPVIGAGFPFLGLAEEGVRNFVCEA
jgi:hypothetical protein